MARATLLAHAASFWLSALAIRMPLSPQTWTLTRFVRCVISGSFTVTGVPICMQPWFNRERHSGKAQAMKTLIQNGTIVTAGESYKGDVLIDGETIAAVGRNLPRDGAEVIDAGGKHLLPGGIDVHVHLALPFGGTVSSDDFFTGHRAAAFGGTTTAIDFAMQAVGGTLNEALDTWHAKSDDKACIDYGYHAGITDLNDRVMQEISDLPRHGVASIKLFMAYKGVFQVDD